jgi:hypothetical protein
MTREQEITEEILELKDRIWELQKERVQLKKKTGLKSINYKLSGGSGDSGWYGKSN